MTGIIIDHAKINPRYSCWYFIVMLKDINLIDDEMSKLTHRMMNYNKRMKAKEIDERNKKIS